MYSNVLISFLTTQNHQPFQHMHLKKGLLVIWLTFVFNKVKRIRQRLNEKQTKGKHVHDSVTSSFLLSILQPNTEDEVGKIIMSSSPTTCALDPIPKGLVKDVL